MCSYKLTGFLDSEPPCLSGLGEGGPWRLPPYFLSSSPCDSSGSGHQAKLQGVQPKPQPKDRVKEHAKRPASCGLVGLGQGRGKGLRDQKGSMPHPGAKAGCAAMPQETTTVCE